MRPQIRALASPGKSPAQVVAAWPRERRDAFLARIAVDVDAARALGASWEWRARPEQLPPAGNWSVWVALAGRGWGKTRTGAEFLHGSVEEGAEELCLVGRTAADVRDTMIKGPSGVIRTAKPWLPARYVPSERTILWEDPTRSSFSSPKRGRPLARALCFSADEPDQLRGPNIERAWCDELAAWRFLRESWDNLEMMTRAGDPRVFISTTPRPVALLREILAAAGTVVTRGSTYDNAINLAAKFITRIRERYEGTRLGRQELHAELLTDTPGALWTLRQIDALRVRHAPELARIVVAIDPAVADPRKAGTEEDTAECGIVVVAMGVDGHGYVLEDCSRRDHPAAWAQAAIDAYDRWQADRIVAEVNNGGALVEALLRSLQAQVSYSAVHASRGKQTRAEPVSALYERGLVHHVGAFSALEDQMTTWVPGMASPDRMDALVWGLTELQLGPPEVGEYQGGTPRGSRRM